jgi:hypothetical protein
MEGVEVGLGVRVALTEGEFEGERLTNNNG